jgi:hypothetical protein
MTIDRKDQFVIAALINVLVILSAYVGAYFAMVRPTKLSAFEGIMTVPSVYWGPCGAEIESGARDRLLLFFWPAIETDRRLRPSVWPPWQDLFPEMGGPRL